MNIALCGATGKVGSRILKELLSRHHHVVVLVRKAKSFDFGPGVTVKQSDLSDSGQIAAAIRGVDAVVSAYGPPPGNTDELVAVTTRLIEAVRQAGVPRLLVVGGAGGLEVAPGVTLIDSGHLPAEWLPIAKSHVKALKVLQQSDIDWTCLSPAAFLEPGERTGRFRLGKNELIANEKHESKISMEDYAIALVDEIEKPAHEKQRFSVGY